MSINKWFGVGRATKDMETRYTQGADPMAITNFTLAVDRKDTADFIRCVAFGKRAETLEKYGHKGIKLAVEGHIQTGSYTNKDGAKVYTTEVVVDNFDFCEKKADGEQTTAPAPQTDGGWLNIPDDIDADLPFN